MSGSQPPKELKDALSALFIDPSQPKDKYEFWETQPVAQFHEDDDQSDVREISSRLKASNSMMVPM